MANPKGSPQNLKPFKPGQSGNPGGKPVNARNRVTAKFLEVLATDFEANGKEAVEAARTKDPVGYMRAIVALLPKEIVIEKPLDGVSDDELATIIDTLRAARTVAGSSPDEAGGGTGETGGKESTGGVRSVH